MKLGFTPLRSQAVVEIMVGHQLKPIESGELPTKNDTENPVLTELKNEFNGLYSFCFY